MIGERTGGSQVLVAAREHQVAWKRLARKHSVAARSPHTLCMQCCATICDVCIISSLSQLQCKPPSTLCSYELYVAWVDELFSSQLSVFSSIFVIAGEAAAALGAQRGSRPRDRGAKRSPEGMNCRQAAQLSLERQA